ELDVFDASLVRCVLRVVCDVFPADRRHEPFKDAVAISADDEMVAVFALIRVRWRNSWQRRTCTLTDLPRKMIFRKHPFEHRKDGFVQCDIDDLADAVFRVITRT